MICRNVIVLDARISSCSTDGRVSSLCFVGNGWEAHLCESAYAFWGFVHIRWSPAHQTAHPAQRSGLAVVCVQLLHTPLLPQRGRHRQGARLLHGSFQEGSAEEFLCEGQRAVLHAGREEQNGALDVWVAVCLTVHLCLLICRGLQAYYILSRAPYDVKGSMKKFGISKLLDGGVYKAAYPLHDVRTIRVLVKLNENGKCSN